ncbi:uncharacterized protein SPPG_09275 [Spizellomyces punctatus DAOM BR117]|uniref:Uncharacterized protein n=1 Tax=Spizellomyces punctatus (strain DAOM BR117) TaxID=645134 RepID=A0A0L0HEH0_SPIPD|nr:uncharacterized protein SPPG_09275 [Spizellomyces punctatus DAOM BR117]KNC99138.1 hypothetical protein SPPG_09275 [Spizellomyces punctatus DAOM BR117]|eukprot:XP_016607178.1 hypothetical protein SPPG_09275 [Spizellomyces punctatus DAOM BR117]
MKYHVHACYWFETHRLQRKESTHGQRSSRQGIMAFTDSPRTLQACYNTKNSRSFSLKRTCLRLHAWERNALTRNSILTYKIHQLHHVACIGMLEPARQFLTLYMETWGKRAKNAMLVAADRSRSCRKG